MSDVIRINVRPEQFSIGERDYCNRRSKRKGINRFELYCATKSSEGTCAKFVTLIKKIASYISFYLKSFFTCGGNCTKLWDRATKEYEKRNIPPKHRQLMQNVSISVSISNPSLTKEKNAFTSKISLTKERNTFTSKLSLTKEGNTSTSKLVLTDKELIKEIILISEDKLKKLNKYKEEHSSRIIKELLLRIDKRFYCKTTDNKSPLDVTKKSDSEIIKLKYERDDKTAAQGYYLMSKKSMSQATAIEKYVYLRGKFLKLASRNRKTNRQTNTNEANIFLNILQYCEETINNRINDPINTIKFFAPKLKPRQTKEIINLLSVELFQSYIVEKRDNADIIEKIENKFNTKNHKANFPVLNKAINLAIELCWEMLLTNGEYQFNFEDNDLELHGKDRSKDRTGTYKLVMVFPSLTKDGNRIKQGRKKYLKNEASLKRSST